MFGDRLMAGHQVLVLGIGVRIPVREPRKQLMNVSCFLGSETDRFQMISDKV